MQTCVCVCVCVRACVCARVRVFVRARVYVRACVCPRAQQCKIYTAHSHAYKQLFYTKTPNSIAVTTNHQHNASGI